MSEERVYVVSRSGNGGRNHVHTDPECHRLRHAKNVFEKPRRLVDDEKICRVCSGEFDPPESQDTNAMREKLSATAPEDLGLSPLGERPGGDDA